jgi:hypothetical protein
LHFVRTASTIAQLDLTDFFEKWGFLTPVDYTSEGTRFTVTQAQVDALKTEIAAKGYLKPQKDFTGITDRTVNSYK